MIEKRRGSYGKWDHANLILAHVCKLTVAQKGRRPHKDIITEYPLKQQLKVLSTIELQTKIKKTEPTT